MRIGVVGGGLAGITAALRCADAGHTVTLVEARPASVAWRRRSAAGPSKSTTASTSSSGAARPTARCSTGSAWPTRSSCRTASTCRCSYRAAHRPARTGLPAPLHLAGALLRYHPLPVAQRARAVAAALTLRAVDPAGPATDEQSFGAWLAAHGQRAAAVAALWDLIGVATLNAHADDASLALAATVFRTGLLTDAAAGDIGRARVPKRRRTKCPAAPSTSSYSAARKAA